MTRPAPDCMSQDNTRADNMSGKVIYDLMHGGPGTGSLNTGSTTAAALNTDYGDIENRLRAASAKLEEGWTGASSDAATQAASPINKAVIDMQTALQDADRSIDNQGVQFGVNKDPLKPVSAERPESGFWNDVTPWETDTDREISGYNAAEAENRRLYTQYQGASAANRDQLPSNISGVTSDSLDVTIAENSGSETPNSNSSSSSRFTNPQGSSERLSGTGQATVPTSSSSSSYVPPPSISGDGTTNTSGNTGNPSLPTQMPGGSTVGNQPGGGGLSGGGLSGGGFVSPGGIGTGTGSGRQGAGRQGAGMPGAGGSRGGGPGGATAGRGGLGGGHGGGLGGGLGSAAGRPGDSAFGPGGKSGVLGANDAAGSRGGFGPTGSTAAGGRGGAGTAGMGGMGGGAANGNGDEDGEHSLADYLITEENGNTIVGDMPLTSPPVIGG